MSPFFFASKFANFNVDHAGNTAVVLYLRMFAKIAHHNMCMRLTQTVWELNQEITMPKFKGIVAMAPTRRAAITEYKLTALGKNVKVLANEDVAFVSRASSASDVFNPFNGEIDLSVDSKLLKRVNFASMSSFDSPAMADKQFEYQICTSGCQSHVVSDAKLPNCPCCGTSFSADDSDVDLENLDDSDDEDDVDLDADLDSEDSSESGDDDSDEDDSDEDDSDEDDSDEDDSDEDDSDDADDSDEDADDSDEDDSDDSDEDDSDEEVDDEIAEAAASLSDDEEDADITAGLDEDDSEDADVDDAEDVDDDSVVAVASSFREARDAFMESVTADGQSLSSEGLPAEYMVCANSACGVHIVSTSKQHVCPMCLSGTDEPEEAPEDDSDVPDDMSDIDAELDGADSDDDTSESDDLTIMGDGDEDDLGGEGDGDEDDGTGEDTDGDASDDKSDDGVSESASWKAPIQKILKAAGVAKVPATTTLDVTKKVLAAFNAANFDISVSKRGKVTVNEIYPPGDEGDEQALVITSTAGKDSAYSWKAKASQSGDGDETDVTVEDLVPEDAPADDLDVALAMVAGKQQWTAYFKGRPVAMASEAAAEHKDVFAKPVFGHAVLQAASQIGVRKALQSFNFSSLNFSAIPEATVARKIKAGIAEASAQIEERQKHFEKHFLDALATAAMGISRNFFLQDNDTPLENPLRKALASSLSTAGVMNSEVLIDRAISQSADAYHSVLFTKALDLVAQPVEVLQSMSKAIKGSAALPSVSVSAAQPSRLEDRLSGLGTSVSADKPNKGNNQPTATASSNVNDLIARAVSSLGKK